MGILWTLIVAAIAYFLLRKRHASIVIGLMVLSHWLMDAIVYPIMPLLFRQSPMTGIGLMTSGAGFIASICY